MGPVRSEMGAPVLGRRSRIGEAGEVMMGCGSLCASMGGRQDMERRGRRRSSSKEGCLGGRCYEVSCLEEAS